MSTKLTFGHLERMIETWATDLHEYYNIFMNQSEEFKSVFWRVHFNKEKINLISTKLALLNYMHGQLEERFMSASSLQQDLEKMVIHLEQSVNMQNPIDTQRQRVYGIAEVVNCHVNSYKNNIESSTTITTLNETQKLKDPMEQVAKIMMTLLEALHYIELKMEQMQNELNYVSCANKELFCARFKRN